MQDDSASEIKAEIYEAVATINRSFAQITSALYQLASQGVLAEDYAHTQEVPLSEMAARINCYIIARVNERELDDRNHFSRMRASLEKKRKRNPRAPRCPGEAAPKESDSNIRSQLVYNQRDSSSS